MDLRRRFHPLRSALCQHPHSTTTFTASLNYRSNAATTPSKNHHTRAVNQHTRNPAPQILPAGLYRRLDYPRRSARWQHRHSTTTFTASLNYRTTAEKTPSENHQTRAVMNTQETPAPQVLRAGSFAARPSSAQCSTATPSLNHHFQSQSQLRNATTTSNAKSPLRRSYQWVFVAGPIFGAVLGATA